VRGRFKKAKERVLGKKYELDVIFIDSKTMRNLNKKYRHKNKDTNVLAFALSTAVGQIFLNPIFIKKEKGNIFSLYLHGLLHLAGYSHGKSMDSEEKKLWHAI